LLEAIGIKILKILVYSNAFFYFRKKYASMKKTLFMATALLPFAVSAQKLLKPDVR